MTDSQIEELILSALESLNETLEDDQKIAVSAKTKMFGGGADIDSISLVSLVVDIEARLSIECGKDISLTDDKAMTREKSPFQNVQTLKEYIAELVG